MRSLAIVNYIICSVLAGMNLAILLADAAQEKWDSVAVRAAVVGLMAALVATRAKEVRRG